MSSEGEENISETAGNAQLILQNVSILSDLSSQLRKETKNGENYLSSLNTLLSQAEKDVSSLNQSVDSLVTIAKKMVFLSLQIVPSQDPNFKSLQTEADKLLNVLDEITNHDELDEKWKHLTLKKNPSTKCLNSDDKYPEHCSRESLLDTSNFVGLPTVPEDIFTNFHRPSRSLSSSSLKNLRKVKMCLQKVSDIDAETMTEQVYQTRGGMKTTSEGNGYSFKETNTDGPVTVSVGTTTHQTPQG